MDEFVSTITIVVDYLLGIFNDLMNLAMQYPFMAVIVVSGIAYLVFDNVLLILSGHKGSKAKTSPVKVSKLASAGTFGVGGVGIFDLGKKNGASSVSVSMAAKSGAAPIGYSSVVGGSKFTKGKPVAAKDNGHYSLSSRRSSKKKSKSSDPETSADTSDVPTYTTPSSTAMESRSGWVPTVESDPPPRRHDIDIFVD